MNGSFHVPSSEPLSASSVWGPTCDSIDLVCPVTQLPSGLQVGDWVRVSVLSYNTLLTARPQLGFDNMGAYTLCAASQFNGFEVSKVIYTTGGAVGADVRRVLAAFAAEGHGC
jgi:ornithine decarboxylase